MIKTRNLPRLWMETVLTGLIWISCFLHTNDVLVYSHTFEEHLEHLQQMFARLHQTGLHLKAQKCLFWEKKCLTLVMWWQEVASILIPPRLRRWRITVHRRMSVKSNSSSDWHPTTGALGQSLHILPHHFIPFWRRIPAGLWSAGSGRICLFEERAGECPCPSIPQFHSNYPFILETDTSMKGLGAVLAQQQEDGKVCICVTITFSKWTYIIMLSLS